MIKQNVQALQWFVDFANLDLKKSHQEIRRSCSSKRSVFLAAGGTGANWQ